jgi:MFS family permease
VPFLLAAAAAFATAFILHERSRRTEPLVDLSLFRNRNYSVGMVTGVILNFALMGAMFLMPLYCQSVLGIDPVHTGTLMLPFAISLLVASPLAGILSDRIGGKTLLVIGLAILAASDFLVARFRVDTQPSQLVLPFIVMGVGMGLSMTPLTNLTLYGVPAEKAGGASGLLSTARQIGAVMGVAVFSVILQASMGSAIAVHAAEVKGLPPAAQAALVGSVKNGGLSGMTGGATGPGASSIPQAVADGILLAVKESFTDGVNTTFRIAALVGLAAVLVSLLMAGRRRPALVLDKGAGGLERRADALHQPTMPVESDMAVGE